MEATSDNGVEGTPTPDPVPPQGPSQNDIALTPNETETKPQGAHETNPRLQQNTVTRGTHDAEDEELFVTQEPLQNRVRRTPHLTNAEIRESVKVGLDDNSVGRMPKSGFLGHSLRSGYNITNNKSKGKGRKRSRANDVDIATLGGYDIIADAQAASLLPPIPTSTQGNKGNALSELIASLPEEARSAASPDKQLVIDATKKFTKKPRADKQGGWKHVNLTTSLYHHQVLGAGFMRGREKSKEQPTGGMLCDVMGLGKTIQTLANIVDGEYEKLEDDANTTLIVVPRSLIDHWKAQIQKHVRNTFLKPTLCHYAGSRNDSDDIIELFLSSKVILTSYDEVRSSYPKFEKPDDLSPEELLRWGVKVYKESAGPLHQIRFRRIILDEGQQIRNPESQTSIAVRALHAHYKWILTGTPLLNHSAEFWAYFHFLGVPNIGRFSSFIRNFCSGSDLSNQRLVNIVQKIVFRRTHRSRLFECPIITLPSLGEQTLLVKPLAIEQALYEIVVNSFILKINSLVDHDEQGRCFLTMILRLRMLNSHLLCLQDQLKTLLIEDGNMAKLESAVASAASDEADINRDIYVRLEELVEATKQAKELEANHHLSIEGMFRSYQTATDDYNFKSGDAEDWVDAAGNDIPSSKVLKTRDVIKEWLQDAPDTKLVIFTQFRAMTAIFAKMCKKEKWSYTMLTGDMDFTSRTQSLDDFQTREEIKILIASLKVGGTGLDITAANKCILVEPWWNDAVQQQAFCRLFRIGQTRDVQIVKLVASNTIDDYMMELQKLKLKEIEGAIGDATLPGIEGQLIGHFGTIEQLPNGEIRIHR